MGDAKKDDLRVSFDSRLKLRFLGSQITTDAGSLVANELRTREFSILGVGPTDPEALRESL